MSFQPNSANWHESASEYKMGEKKNNKFAQNQLFSLHSTKVVKEV